MTTCVPARDIKPGQKIDTVSGVKTVRRLSRGMYRGMLMIEYTDGEWAHAYPGEVIEIAAPA